jgi:hypothetical protein
VFPAKGDTVSSSFLKSSSLHSWGLVSQQQATRQPVFPIKTYGQELANDVCLGCVLLHCR